MQKSLYSGDYRTMCQALIEVRKEAGLSQRQLANRLGVQHTWVSKVESAERRVDLIEFKWYCEACGVDPALVVKAVFGRRSESDGGRL